MTFPSLPVGLLLAALAVPAHASSVFLVGDSNIFTTNADNEVFFQNVFNGTTVVNYSAESLSGLGTTASETFQGSSSTVQASDLVGADFLIYGFSRNSISAGELSVIDGFVDGGGSLFLIGEGATSFNSLNTAVNSVLSTIGSSMSISLDPGDNFDIGGFTSFSVTGATPFANGVDTWNTAFAAGINLGSGTAVISGTADNGPGVAVALEELSTTAAAVPLPAGLSMMLGALAALGLVARRRA